MRSPTLFESATPSSHPPSQSSLQTVSQCPFFIAQAKNSRIWFQLGIRCPESLIHTKNILYLPSKASPNESHSSSWFVQRSGTAEILNHLQKLLFVSSGRAPDLILSPKILSASKYPSSFFCSMRNFHRPFCIDTNNRHPAPI